MAKAETGRSERLYFEVEDTGLGIAPHELDSLFDPFVQSESGRKSMQGTGLGLPISRQFVRLMGGDIKVKSRVGVGTTFSFEIEYKLSDFFQDRTSLNAKRVIGLAEGQQNYRILVVEDVEENRLFLVSLLQSVGLDVRIATNGIEAIALWEEWEPDLIWMDMLMPEMDGYEATKQIKTTLKGQATIIIALTANAFNEDRSAMLKVGCDDFVRKPFQEAVLFEKMAHYLGVRYIYQEQQQCDAFSERSDRNTTSDGTASDRLDAIISLDPQALLAMPRSWVEQLWQAALCLDHQLIMELVEVIPDQHINLAQSLTNLVENFRLDIIIDLTETALK